MTRTVKAFAVALLLASPAWAADDPDTLTAEDKALFLKCAYLLSGHNSLAILGSVDMSGWSKEELELCTEPKPFVEAVPPTALAKADRPVSDVCSRQGLRKVTVGNGWRCRK